MPTGTKQDICIAIDQPVVNRDILLNEVLLYRSVYVQMTKYLILIVGWFLILCLEDNKKYLSLVNKLESLDGLGLSPMDTIIGSNVIWHYRGAPYKVQILEVHSNQLMNWLYATSSIGSRCGTRAMDLFLAFKLCNNAFKHCKIHCICM